MKKIQRGNNHKIAAYILGLPALLLLALGVAMIFVPDDAEQLEAGIGISIFSLFFVLPAVLLFLRSRQLQGEADMLESIAAIAESTRRIAVHDIASQLEISPLLARRVLLKALADDLIDGNFDRQTGEFFTEEGKSPSIVYKFCPVCGSPFNRSFLEGESIRCDSCNTLIR